MPFARQHAFALAAALAMYPRLANAQRPEGPQEDVKAREEWFWRQRTYPFADRPYERLNTAVDDVRRRLSAGASFSVDPLPGVWRTAGPMGFLEGPEVDAGRVSAIALAPGKVFIGAASGGVWRSSNAGRTWTPLTDNECALTIGAIAVDPVNPAIVYAATGEANTGSRGCGILRSTDGGDTWQNYRAGLSTSAPYFAHIVVDRATAGTTTSTVLIAVGGGGIYRSANSGQTWTLASPAASTGGAVIAHPTRAGTYYASLANGVVYRSTDAGASWVRLPPLSGSSDVTGRIELAVSQAAPEKLWALLGNATVALFRWDEIAGTWTKLSAKGALDPSTVYTCTMSSQFTYNLVLAVDPRDADRILMSGVCGVYSTDGGENFKALPTFIHVDWHALVFDPADPSIMWAGTDGGVFVSTDGAQTWTSRNLGLAITQYYPGVSATPDGSRMLGGAQDNGSHLSNGGAVWDWVNAGDGGYTAINPQNPAVIWTETQNSYGPARIDPAGGRAGTGIDNHDRVAFIPPFVMDPTTPTKLYFGTQRVYRTSDDGKTWTPISGDLTRGTGVVFTIAVSPADSNVIYAGTTDGQAWRTSDGGITWLQATGLPNRAVTRIAAHPSDPLRALVVLSGINAPHVFESTDGFRSLTDRSGNLGDVPVNAAVYVANANLILIGTDVGVFQSSAAGSNWQPGPSGLPNVIVQDLVYKPTTGLLIAATYGRGMWTYNVNPVSGVLRGDVNGDGKIDALDALLAENALVAQFSQVITDINRRADANCDGIVDGADVILILRAAVGASTPGACVGSIR